MRSAGRAAGGSEAHARAHGCAAPQGFEEREKAAGLAAADHVRWMRLPTGPDRAVCWQIVGRAQERGMKAPGKGDPGIARSRAPFITRGVYTPPVPRGPCESPRSSPRALCALASGKDAP